MRKALMYGAMRPLTRAHAVEPVPHVFEREVVNAHGRDFRLARRQNVAGTPALVDVRVVLVGAFFFDQLITRAALATLMSVAFLPI
jgi:hypothetical protein